MKKTYSKPQVAFDSFEVATNIAACAQRANLNIGDCSYTVAGLPVFVSGANGCRFIATDGSYGVCYYVPTEDTNLFTS
jgi:hypothetical protein